MSKHHDFEEKVYNPYHPGYNFNSELLFRIHLIVIVIFVVLAFLAPLGTIILGVVFHRAFFVYNRGCIINQLERKVCGNPQYDFFQELSYRLTGQHIGKKGSKWFDVVLIVSILVISVLVAVCRFSHPKSRAKT